MLKRGYNRQEIIHKKQYIKFIFSYEIIGIMNALNNSIIQTYRKTLNYYFKVFIYITLIMKQAK